MRAIFYLTTEGTTSLNDIGGAINTASAVGILNIQGSQLDFTGNADDADDCDDVTIIQDRSGLNFLSTEQKQEYDSACS